VLKHHRIRKEGTCTGTLYASLWDVNLKLTQLMQLVRELLFVFNRDLIIFKVIAFLALLGAFTKLQKAAVSYVISLSVCLSTWNNLAPIEWILHDI